MSYKSPYFVEAKPLTRLDEFRERLDRVESRLGGLEKAGLGADPLEIPDLLDQSSVISDELERDGKLAPEEAARFESIQAQLRGKAAVFLRAIGGARALKEARLVRNPEPARWWWFLDQILAKKRLRQGKHLIKGALILFAALALLGILYRAFLAPSPQEQALYRSESMAESLIAAGDLNGALQEVENALLISPADPDLLVRKGVLLQSLGKQALADEAYKQAEAALNDRKLFLLMRGQDFMRVGKIEAGVADAKEALGIDPDSPEAYLMLGQAYELLENFGDALQAYEKASSLASEQDRPELTALARVRLAYLMQRIPAMEP